MKATASVGYNLEFATWAELKFLIIKLVSFATGLPLPLSVRPSARYSLANIAII